MHSFPVRSEPQRELSTVKDDELRPEQDVPVDLNVLTFVVLDPSEASYISSSVLGPSTSSL